MGGIFIIIYKPEQLGIGDHVTAKIKWIAVKIAQAQLDQFPDRAIKLVNEVPPAEQFCAHTVLCSSLHCNEAHGIRVHHQPCSIIYSVHCKGTQKMSL